MPANYPEWVSGVTPHTNSDAHVTRHRKVDGAKVIRVTGATYRGSRPIDGVFELVSDRPQQVAGEQRFEVYCVWFGVKPHTKYPRISVTPSGWKLLRNYSGDVIDNLSA
jgi:hypothetical protein